MSVKINISWHLQQFTNGRMAFETMGGTVGECLENLEAQFPGIKKGLHVEQGELNGPYQIYVKSANSYTAKLNKPVQENDELAIRFTVAGG